MHVQFFFGWGIFFPDIQRVSRPNACQTCDDRDEFVFVPLVDLTPCVSPLPHNGPLLERPGTDQVENNTEMNRVNNLLGKAEVNVVDFHHTELYSK